MDDSAIREYGYRARKFTNGHVDWLVFGVAAYALSRYLSLPDFTLKKSDWSLILSAMFWCAIMASFLVYTAFPFLRGAFQRLSNPRITVDQSSISIPVGFSMRKQIVVPFDQIQRLFFDPISKRLRVTFKSGSTTFLQENFEDEGDITELRELLYRRTTPTVPRNNSFDYLINPTKFANFGFPLMLMFDALVVARLLGFSLPTPLVSVLNSQPWILIFLGFVGFMTCTWASAVALTILDQHRNPPQIKLSEGQLTVPPGWFGWKPQVIVLSELTEAYFESTIVLMKNKSPRFIDSARFSTPEHFNEFSKSLRTELETRNIPCTPDREVRQSWVGVVGS